MDDFGYKLIAMGKGASNFMTKMGQFLVAALPKVIKSLTVIGTLAMLLVAGEIYLHNVEGLHDKLHSIPDMISALGLGLIVGSSLINALKSSSIATLAVDNLFIAVLKTSSKFFLYQVF
jgi:predicted DNA repair protein MutK